MRPVTLYAPLLPGHQPSNLRFNCILPFPMIAAQHLTEAGKLQRRVRASAARKCLRVDSLQRRFRFFPRSRCWASPLGIERWAIGHRIHPSHLGVLFANGSSRAVIWTNPCNRLSEEYRNRSRRISRPADGLELLRQQR